MTVDQLLAQISSAELSEWAAYYRLEPFGDERADLRAGIVASTVANTAQTRKRKAFKPADFMPKFGRREQSWEQQLELARLMASAGWGEIRE